MREVLLVVLVLAFVVLGAVGAAWSGGGSNYDDGDY